MEKCDEKRPSLELLLRNTAHVAHKSYSEDTADNDSDVGMNDSDTESEDNSVLQAARDRVRATEGSLHWCFRGQLGRARMQTRTSYIPRIAKALSGDEFGGSENCMLNCDWGRS